MWWQERWWAEQEGVATHIVSLISTYSNAVKTPGRGHPPAGQVLCVSHACFPMLVQESRDTHSIDEFLPVK